MVRNSSTSSALARRSRSSSAMRRRPNQVFHRLSPDCAPGTIIRFSRHVIDENSCAIWNVRRRPRWNNSCGGRPVISRPSIVTRPDVG